MMTRSRTLLIILTALLLAGLSACAAQPTPQPTPEPPAASEAVLKTEAPTAPAVEAAATEAPTLAPTDPPEPTPEPVEESVTEAVVEPITTEANPVSGVMLRLAQNTICRTGPATNYPSVASIPAELQVKAVGRLADDDVYYYIESPEAPQTRCWVFGQGAAVQGNRASLPLVEALPTPTPDAKRNFSITYSGIKHCGDDYSFKFIVTNTDETVWQSIKVRITDAKTKIAADYKSNRFEEYANCQLDNYQGDLTEGERVFMTPFNPGHFDYSPYGGTYFIRVTLCTEKDWKGVCMTKEIKVNP